MVVEESFKLNHSNTHLKIYLDFLNLVVLQPREINTSNLVFLLLVLTSSKRAPKDQILKSVSNNLIWLETIWLINEPLISSLENIWRECIASKLLSKHTIIFLLWWGTQHIHDSSEVLWLTELNTTSTACQGMRYFSDVEHMWPLFQPCNRCTHVLDGGHCYYICKQKCAEVHIIIMKIMISRASWHFIFVVKFLSVMEIFKRFP